MNIPVAARRRIAVNADASRAGTCPQIIHRAADGNRAATSVRNNSLRRPVHSYRSRSGGSVDIPADVTKLNAARPGFRRSSASDINQLDGAASCLRFGIAVNSVRANPSRSGLQAYSTLNVVHFHVARSDVRANFCFGRDINRVINADVIERVAPRFDSDQTALLIHGRMVPDLI